MNLNKAFLLILIIFIGGCVSTPVDYDEILKLSMSDDSRYQGYNAIIKERILQAALADKRWAERKGEVTVIFMLTSSGKLRNVKAMKDISTADKKLLTLATSAIKKATPFPPFPETLQKYPELFFKITLSFEPKNSGNIQPKLN